MSWYYLGSYWVRSSLLQKDLGITMDARLKMYQQCTVTANKANCLLSCIRRKVTRSLKEAGGISALQQGYNSLVFTVFCLSSPWMLTPLSSHTSITLSFFT